MLLSVVSSNNTVSAILIPNPRVFDNLFNLFKRLYLKEVCPVCSCSCCGAILKRHWKGFDISRHNTIQDISFLSSFLQLGLGNRKSVFSLSNIYPWFPNLFHPASLKNTSALQLFLEPWFYPVGLLGLERRKKVKIITWSCLGHSSFKFSFCIPFFLDFLPWNLDKLLILSDQQTEISLWIGLNSVTLQKSSLRHFCKNHFCYISTRYKKTLQRETLVQYVTHWPLRGDENGIKILKRRRLKNWVKKKQS